MLDLNLTCRITWTVILEACGDGHLLDTTRKGEITLRKLGDILEPSHEVATTMHDGHNSQFGSSIFLL